MSYTDAIARKAAQCAADATRERAIERAAIEARAGFLRGMAEGMRDLQELADIHGVRIVFTCDTVRLQAEIDKAVARARRT